MSSNVNFGGGGGGGGGGVNTLDQRRSVQNPRRPPVDSPKWPTPQAMAGSSALDRAATGRRLRHSWHFFLRRAPAAVSRNALLAFMSCMLLGAAGEPQVSAVDHIHLAGAAAVVAEGRCDGEIILGIRERCQDFETVFEFGQHSQEHSDDANFNPRDQCRVLETAAEGCATALVSIWSELDAADRSRCGPGVTHIAGIVSTRVISSRSSAGGCAPGALPRHDLPRGPAHQTNTTSGGTGWDRTGAPGSTVATGNGAAPMTQPNTDVPAPPAVPGLGPIPSTHGENKPLPSRV